MPAPDLPRANIECKLRLRDPDGARRVARGLGAAHAGLLEQEAVFYAHPDLRLKRRATVGRPAEWILYSRSDDATARASRYELLTDTEAQTRFDGLGPPIGTVRKRRELWLLDNVRIHIDHVDGLGDFLELEAVVGEGHPPENCRASVDRLLAALAPVLGEIVPVAYADLLAARPTA
ncbi:MAG: class IV adenylate cyclase [Phycisphaerales bacterium]